MNKAFTLAEVLITLTIIGIVAAVTIPSVIANYQQQEFKTGLRKAVSVLNEAIQTNIIIEGETPFENDDLFDYLKRHMSIASTGVFKWTSNSHSHSNNMFYTVDGMRFEVFKETSCSIINNIKSHETGTQLLSCGLGKSIYECISGVCTLKEYAGRMQSRCGSYGLTKNPSNGKIASPCLITVDVNGDRKPNPKISKHHKKGDLLPSGNVLTSDYYEMEGNAFMFPLVTDKKVTDVFNILITEDRAIPFGVVAQRAMYEK